MALTVSRQTRPQTPPGQYAGRCIDVFHAGWFNNLNGVPTPKCKVVFYLGQDPTTKQELYIDLFETLSLGKKANLTKWIEAWIGRRLTKEEVDGFDLERLLGAPALIQVVEKTRNDGTVVSIIGSIMKLPKGMACPAGAPKGYVKDADRDTPMAKQFPPPADLTPQPPSGPAQPHSMFEDTGDEPADANDKAAATLASNEDDDLPF